jgi:hypothetical protein|tara:strand:+ start:1749 stop:1874 length:126 start_codon:yes stop_codon:yes gene_type:complete
MRYRLEKTVSEMGELVVWLATLDENSEQYESGAGDTGQRAT